MSLTPPPDRLYRLLPEIYRVRDAAKGSPMRALLAVMDEQLDRVQTNIDQLYENWFIETCDEWVVPYIGDLLGVRLKYPVDNDVNSLRPVVANTLDYRRRKGTASMLEDLARDVTGWPARAVEFFTLLAATENLNHIRPAPFRTPDLRDVAALERLDGPFESAGRFVDVRRIATRGGKYNVPNVGIYLHRLDGFAANVVDETTQQELGVPATPDAPSAAAGPFARWRFSQLGVDLQLFNPARTAAARPLESDMPGPLRRRPAWQELVDARVALAAGDEPRWAWFDTGEPALRIIADGRTLPREEIQICDLSDWVANPPLPISFSVPSPTDPTVTISRTTRVAVDPRLGRLVFIDGQPRTVVRVAYYYGGVAEIGGGFYPRRDADATFAAGATALVSVADPAARVDGALSSAIASWSALAPPVSGVIEIDDGGIYAAPSLTVPPGLTLEIRAREEVRPVLQLSAPWSIKLGAGSRLRLSGLWVTGAPLVVDSAGDAEHELVLSHCTLAPGSSGLRLAATAQGRLTVRLASSVSGAIDLASGRPDSIPTLSARDSIVDGAGAPSAIVHVGDAELDGVTVLGMTSVQTLEASDCIFADGLDVARMQTGCVRFSYLPEGARAPRAYRCQPALAASTAADADAATAARQRIVPAFVSRSWGDAAYAQLSLDGPPEIAAGAANGAEMGGYRLLMQPMRIANLRAGLDEYLRFGLEAGIFFVH